MSYPDLYLNSFAHARIIAIVPNPSSLRFKAFETQAKSLLIVSAIAGLQASFESIFFEFP
jgi:hypothetical protein